MSIAMSVCVPRALRMTASPSVFSKLSECVRESSWIVIWVMDLIWGLEAWLLLSSGLCHCD